MIGYLWAKFIMVHMNIPFSDIRRKTKTLITILELPARMERGKPVYYCHGYLVRKIDGRIIDAVSTENERYISIASLL